MWTSSKILRHIDNLRRDEVFTTRDMLSYGRRGAVDQTLYRLVKGGFIIRLARGVFIKNVEHQRDVGVTELARIKANAFGKQVMTHAHDCAIKMGLIQKPNEETMFNVTGHTSSFLTRKGRIYLQGVANRRFVLNDRPHGMLMRAFWYMEFAGHPVNYGTAILRNLNRNERLEMKKKARWIPSWLSDIICHCKD